MSSSDIDVWLVEDNDLYRHTITDLVNGSPGIRCSHAFTSCESALEAMSREYAPEIMLMDIGLPGMNGLEGTQRIKLLSPATQVIMLTVHEDEDKIFEALCAGASGYLLKHASATRIVEAVHEARSGGVPFTAPIARKVITMFKKHVPPRGDYGLSERELEILQCLSEGGTQKQIAMELDLSRHTVDTHLRNIYAKLHVTSGIAAVAKAIKERLI